MMRVFDATISNLIQNTADVHVLKCGYNATQAEIEKHQSYGNDYFVPIGGLIPLGFEGRGAWGNESCSFYQEQFALKFHVEVKDARQCQDASSTWNQITQTIGIAIRKTNTMYLNNIRGINLSNSRAASANNKNTNTTSTPPPPPPPSSPPV